MCHAPADSPRDRCGRQDRGGAGWRPFAGGAFPHDPDPPPPARAAVCRRRPRDHGAAARRRPRRRCRSRRAPRRHDAADRDQQPVEQLPRVRVRGVPADLQPAHRLRPERQAGAGVRRDLGAVRRPRDVQHPGRHEVVRRHARDGARTCASAGASRSTRSRTRSPSATGYLEPGLKDAGVTKIECPDDSTFIAYTTDQSDRIFQIYVPILPEHIYGDDTYKNIDKEKFNGRSSAPARTRSRSGRPTSSRGSCATPTTGVSRASPTRS